MILLLKSLWKMSQRNLLLKLWSFVSWLLVIAVVLLAVLLVGVRLLGYTPFAVLSPSMSPAYLPGDLVYVKAVPPESIEAGQVLTFVANEDLLVVTHRVVENDRTNRHFITKGDANAEADAVPVLYENALGTVSFSLPKLGYLSMHLSTESGRYTAVAIGFGLLLLLILPELFTPEKDKGNKAEKASNKSTGVIQNNNQEEISE